VRKRSVTQLEGHRKAKLIPALSLITLVVQANLCVITPQRRVASLTTTVDEEGFSRVEFTHS